MKNSTGKIQTSDNISEIRLETQNTKDDKEIACASNKFFISIVKSLNSNRSNLNMAIQLLKESYLDKTTEMEIILVTEA
jgi:hypothetical protein